VIDTAAAPGDSPLLTIGVISDSHVSGHDPGLLPGVVAVFEKARVAAILHAGDVSSPQVLEQLAQIAPVTAVRGNRDFFELLHLPAAVQLLLGGITIGLTHGHGGLIRYLYLKIRHTLTHYFGYELYTSYLQHLFPGAKVIIYGHTHRIENRWVNGQLILNPGASYSCRENHYHASIALLRIYPAERVTAEIIYL
jgi:putative phosphoesterase